MIFSFLQTVGQASTPSLYGGSYINNVSTRPLSTLLLLTHRSWTSATVTMTICHRAKIKHTAEGTGEWGGEGAIPRYHLYTVPRTVTMHQPNDFLISSSGPIQ